MKRPIKLVPGFAPRTASEALLASLGKECGSSLVEYAFIFLLFMAIVLGIVDFSRMLYTYHFVSNVAREATRWAAVNGRTCGDDGSCNGTGGMNNGPASPVDIEAYVKGHAPLGIDPSRIKVNASWPVQSDSPAICSTVATQNYPGCTVEVQVGYSFSFDFPLFHTSPLTLSSSSEMIIAH